MILKDSPSVFTGCFCRGDGLQMGAKGDLWSLYGLEITGTESTRSYTIWLTKTKLQKLGKKPLD